MIMKSKKLIVPVIALMVSAVALAGVVYAATTTVSNNGSASTDYYAIDLFNDGAGSELTTSAYQITGIHIYTQKVVGDHIAVLSEGGPVTLGYVAVFNDSNEPVENPTISVGTTVTAGDFSGTTGTMTKNVNGVVITVTIGVGAAVNGYCPITASVSCSGNSSVSPASAQVAAANVSAALDALTFTMTFSSTSA